MLLLLVLLIVTTKCITHPRVPEVNPLGLLKYIDPNFVDDIKVEKVSEEVILEEKAEESRLDIFKNICKLLLMYTGILVLKIYKFMKFMLIYHSRGLKLFNDHIIIFLMKYIYNLLYYYWVEEKILWRQMKEKKGHYITLFVLLTLTIIFLYIRYVLFWVWWRWVTRERFDENPGVPDRKGYSEQRPPYVSPSLLKCFRMLICYLFNKLKDWIEEGGPKELMMDYWDKVSPILVRWKENSKKRYRKFFGIPEPPPPRRYYNYQGLIFELIGKDEVKLVR